MIKADREYKVVCETCGKDAMRRMVWVTCPGVLTADVYYDTHIDSLSARQHLAAIQRLDTFYDKAKECLSQMRQLSAEAKALDAGTITSFDLDTVAPTACNKREEVIIIATIRAYQQSAEVKTDAISVKKFKIELAIAQIIERAERVVEKLKERFMRGQF